MTKIEPIDFIETTALKEREQLRNAVNGVIGEINGAAEDASAAAASALKAEQEATRSAEFAHAAQTAADAAAGDAAKVNQFDARIKGNMKDVSYAPTATEVTAVIMKEDGTIIDRPIPTLDHDRAGMMTPAQMQDISDQLDTLGRDLNNVKAEYLDKYNLTAVQLVRSKTDWEKSPTIPTLREDEYALDDGKRALNAKSAGAHPDLVHINGDQTIAGTKLYPESRYWDRKQAISQLCDVNTVISLVARLVPADAYKENPDARIPAYSQIIGAGAYTQAKFRDKNVSMIAIVIQENAFYASDAETITVNSNYLRLAYRSFARMPALKKADFMYCNMIWSETFLDDTLLDTVIIRTANPDGTLCTLSDKSAFRGTPIEQGTGYIYVPDSQIEDYKAGTNWSHYANQIKKLSELPRA